MGVITAKFESIVSCLPSDTEQAAQLAADGKTFTEEVSLKFKSISTALSEQVGMIATDPAGAAAALLSTIELLEVTRAQEL